MQANGFNKPQISIFVFPVTMYIKQKHSRVQILEKKRIQPFAKIYILPGSSTREAVSSCSTSFAVAHENRNSWFSLTSSSDLCVPLSPYKT